MRIGIDATFAAYERRGMGKYIVNLIKNLIAVDEQNSYVIYAPFRAVSFVKGNTRVCVRDPGRIPFPIWEQLVLPKWAQDDKLDLLHCPVNTGPLYLSPNIK